MTDSKNNDSAPTSLAFVSVLVGLMAFLAPLCAPIAIVLGLAALLQDRGSRGQMMAVVSMVLGGLALILFVLSVLSFLGLSGGVVCCSLCGGSQ